MGGGTEAFPDLGGHCEFAGCNQLDFLPFNCNSCSKIFCLEHKSCRSHECPKIEQNNRRVVVCEKCSITIEVTNLGTEEEKQKIRLHENSKECDPSKKIRPKCPVKRCKKQLGTIANYSYVTCERCQLKVCLAHRLSIDHDCSRKNPNSLLGLSQKRVAYFTSDDHLKVAALAARNLEDCSKKVSPPKSPPSSSSVKAH
ncbi:hypothetical protein C5167_042371 [Papaver somniferum]|uniref:AN1-type domain-containing protein n=1 Tax=Papaver somniferum TaxID=3469 RepID=A0A4Y7L6J0_PAPSO|nr:zinc finger AN1 domain-containing stress-associated protein 12 [Papaver somniferum]RZC79795.1 hypothetical protein C5167_042371 [Papaver somniferum]